MSGERIKLARKKAGLSLRGLADKMGSMVSAQAIGKYERGEMEPGSDVLSRMSRVLGVSMGYLLAAQTMELTGVEFRTKANTTAKDRARVEVEVMERVERYLQVEEILGLKSSEWCAPKGMPKLLHSLEEAESLADSVRREWSLGLDPIPDMTELLEERGIKVLLADLPKSVSGFTCLVKRASHHDPVPVIVVNSNHGLERRRFSIAHELGHQVIDKASSGDQEKLCHRFAGALLVNHEHLQREIGAKRSAVSASEVIGLKRIYRVSASALLMRLEQVGVLSKNALEWSFRTYASGWRSKEPEPFVDREDGVLAEEPKRFSRLVYRSLAEDMISLSKAAELLQVTVAEVEQGMRGTSETHADHR